MDAAHTAAVLIARKPPAEIDLEALQKIEADRLLAELVDARVRCRAIRDLALAEGSFGLALQAEASIRSALAMEMQLLAPLLGPLVKAADIDGEVIERIERVIVDVAAPEPASLEPEHATPSEPLDPEPSLPPSEPARKVVRLDLPRSSLFGFQGSGEQR